MVWLNGDWKEEGKAAVAASDGGFLRGEGVFETLLALGGRVFELERHWQRLKRGCDQFGLEAPDFRIIAGLCEEILKRNEHLPEERVRVRITRSPGHLQISSQVCPSYPEALVLRTSRYLRNERSALTGLKAISYAENVLALREEKKRGAHEVLFANTRGHWCEGAWSNIFAVELGRVITPPISSGCLPGVTREVVMELANQLELEVLEEPRSLASLREMEEIFLTSSLLGIGSVGRFDDRELSRGEITEQLQKSLHEKECSP